MTTRLTKPPVDLRADRLETGARCLAAGTAILAVLVLLGWIVGSASLTSVAPRMVAMNPLTAVYIAIFALQILISSVWLQYFRYGPMEWIWRQLTYGKRLSIRGLD